ncbi:hypothetical protein TB2_019189 [Malus domestica]
MYAFESLNRIYEAGSGLPEFRALYLLKSISALFSRTAMPDDGTRPGLRTCIPALSRSGWTPAVAGVFRHCAQRMRVCVLRPGLTLPSLHLPLNLPTNRKPYARFIGPSSAVLTKKLNTFGTS